LPDGQISHFPVQPSSQKYSAFPPAQIISSVRAEEQRLLSQHSRPMALAEQHNHRLK
jgi:hypothetical protein